MFFAMFNEIKCCFVTSDKTDINFINEDWADNFLFFFFLVLDSPIAGFILL